MEGADKDQLLHRYFEAVNDLYPPWRGEDILVKVARVVDFKVENTPIGSQLEIVGFRQLSCG